MSGGTDGIAWASIAAGALLAYSGLAGKSVLSEIRGLISGRPPSAAAAANTITGASSSSSSGGGSAPPAPASVSGSVALGKMLASSYGWGSGGQWNALYATWQRESGWSPTASNPGSGAYGIPQALGHGTGGAPYPASAQAANPPRYGGTSDPSAQIRWGLSYIASRYGDPEAAWAHEQSAGWY